MIITNIVIEEAYITYQVVYRRVLINKNITYLMETTKKLQRTYIKH